MSDIKKFMKENRLEEAMVSQYYTLEGDTLLCKSATILPVKTATCWIPTSTKPEEEVDDKPRTLPSTRKHLWEVYPCHDGENGRCPIDDIEALWKMIKEIEG